MSSSISKPPHYVIFDLDETLGYFTELSIIWGCLQSVYKAKGQYTFNKLCEVFENDYFRPGIFKVFRFLKKQGDAVRVILYTNNTGSMEWLRLILNFIEMKAGVNNLFYKIVPGYKPGQRTGPCRRSSFDKTYPEIVRCASIPADAKIIFFDDLWHSQMNAKEVTYVRVKAYYRPMRPSHIIHKLQNSYFSFLDYGTNSYLYKCIRNFHRQYGGHDLHKSARVSEKDILTPLRDFLGVQKKTVRHRKNGFNKTKKNKH